MNGVEQVGFFLLAVALLFRRRSAISAAVSTAVSTSMADVEARLTATLNNMVVTNVYNERQLPTANSYSGLGSVVGRSGDRGLAGRVPNPLFSEAEVSRELGRSIPLRRQSVDYGRDFDYWADEDGC